MSKAIEQRNYDAVKKECNSVLSAIPIDWDDLADTNSIWDWIDSEPMTEEQIKDTAKDACWDRLYDDGMDRDLVNELIYGAETNEN